MDYDYTYYDDYTTCDTEGINGNCGLECRVFKRGKETLGSLPLMQYTPSNIVSVWMSRFADEAYSIEDLGKQLDNAISWLSENALCDLENNIIATATKFTRLVADNQTRYKGREGSRNKLVNFCEVFKQVTKIHTEMNAALKAA